MTDISWSTVSAEQLGEKNQLFLQKETLLSKSSTEVTNGWLGPNAVLGQDIVAHFTTGTFKSLINYFMFFFGFEYFIT